MVECTVIWSNVLTNDVLIALGMRFDDVGNLAIPQQAKVILKLIPQSR
jgi:hypothetical protein